MHIPVTDSVVNSLLLMYSGLSADALREKARLLSLCDLAQQQQRWALAELAGRLSLGSAWDAERLVVRASSLNLLGAKIDQETDLVTFEYDLLTLYFLTFFNHTLNFLRPNLGLVLQACHQPPAPGRLGAAARQGACMA